MGVVFHMGNQEFLLKELEQMSDIANFLLEYHSKKGIGSIRVKVELDVWFKMTELCGIR